MSTKEIESKAKRLKVLKNRQESLQAEIDQLEADLKAQLERGRAAGDRQWRKSRRARGQTKGSRLHSVERRPLSLRNVDEVQAGPFRVVWKFVNSSRFDTRRFKAENGTLYNMYTIPNSYRKFSVV